VDEHGFVPDILLQRHRDTEAAKTFLTRLLGRYDVPEVMHTDQLRSSGAAIRELPSLMNVAHQHVISTASPQPGGTTSLRKDTDPHDGKSDLSTVSVDGNALKSS
jgi:hypothetical protein